MNDAQHVISRFRRQIRWVANLTVRQFEPRVELDDAEQEATLLILGYAGLVDTRCHVGKLARIERAAQGNEGRVKRVVGTMLRRDVMRLFGRQATHSVTCVSLDAVHPAAAPTYEPETGWITRLDLSGYVRREYPYLCWLVVDELTIDQIAEMTFTSASTTDRHIADEKERAAVDPWFIERDDDRADAMRLRSRYALTA